MAPLTERRLDLAPNSTIPVTIQAEIRLKVEAHDAPRPREADSFLEPDRALLADGEKKELLSAATRSDLSESIGTVLSGIQLTTLSQQQLDELALLVSERGVVFLRQQDFHPDDQVRAFQRLGDLHKRSTIEHGSGPARLSPEQQNQWHSDSSFESSPPSYSLLNVEDTPEFGGEAAWVSQYGLYDELSAHMKDFVQGLHAVHSSQDESSPVINHHPAVRTHPVTGLKALNVTPGSVTGFAELKKKESDNLLAYLNDQISSETQHIVRWNWEPGCVVIWDNRCTAYRAIPSTYASQRTGARIAIVCERPYLNPESESRRERAQRYAKQQEDEEEKLAMQRRYNNTPLRRILSQQVLGMRPDYAIISEPNAAAITANGEKGPSRADSVLSPGERSEPDSTSEAREERTAQWTNVVNVKLENTKPISVPIQRSNTPMRRILERQVSCSSERRQWR